MKRKLRSLILLSGVLLLSNNVKAVELYNKDGDTFYTGGYMRIGYIAESKDLSHSMGDPKAVSLSSRINFGGKKAIDANSNAFGKAEWRFNPLGTKHSEFMTNRLGYVGYEHTNYGSLTIGRQYSPYYDVAQFADEYEINGGEALGVADDNDDGAFDGVLRSNGALVYRNSISNFDVAVQLQASEEAAGGSASPNRGLGKESKWEREYSTGSSVIYNLNEQVKIGVSANYTKMKSVVSTENIFAPVNTLVDSSYLDRQSYVAGISYKSKIHVALTLSYNTNLYEVDSAAFGQESYISYQYDDLGSHVYVGNNFATTKNKGKLNKAFDGDTSKIHNYASVGLRHCLANKLNIMFEYRHDLRKDSEIVDALQVGGSRAAVAKSASREQGLALVVKYDF